MLLGLAVISAQGGFSSYYVFGDGVCTTTTNPDQYDPPSAVYYHGGRYCNGRTWVEVLAQRQGLTYDTNKNVSFFGHDSAALLTNVASFSAGDAGTSLFVVWVSDADFVGYLNNFSYLPYATNNIAIWTNSINTSLTNHYRAITNLYGKGARTFVLPNAVDLMTVPAYSSSSASDKAFVRQRVVDFNIAFLSMLEMARTNLAGIVIYTPDYFTLLDNVITNAAVYGLTNALLLGNTIDAIADPALVGAATNGPGTNYIFWNNMHPTSKTQVAMADVANQLISPTTISKVTRLVGSNRLDVINMPIGLPGYIYGGTNITSFASWASLTNFSSLTATQAIYAPPTGDYMQFYRLTFTNSWFWP